MRRRDLLKTGALLAGANSLLRAANVGGFARLFVGGLFFWHSSS